MHKQTSIESKSEHNFRFSVLVGNALKMGMICPIFVEEGRRTEDAETKSNGCQMEEGDTCRGYGDRHALYRKTPTQLIVTKEERNGRERGHKSLSTFFILPFICLPETLNATRDRYTHSHTHIHTHTHIHIDAQVHSHIHGHKGDVMATTPLTHFSTFLAPHARHSPVPPFLPLPLIHHSSRRLSSVYSPVRQAKSCGDEKN